MHRNFQFFLVSQAGISPLFCSNGRLAGLPGNLWHFHRLNWSSPFGLTSLQSLRRSSHPGWYCSWQGCRSFAWQTWLLVFPWNLPCCCVEWLSCLAVCTFAYPYSSTFCHCWFYLITIYWAGIRRLSCPFRWFLGSLPFLFLSSRQCWACSKARHCFYHSYPLSQGPSVT